MIFYKKIIATRDVQYFRFSLIQSKSNRFQQNQDQFCSDPNGNRIFGESSSDDEEITCKCSRKRWEMEQLDFIPDEKDGYV